VILAGLLGVEGDEGILGEVFGINDGRVDVGEDLEDRAHADVIAVAGNTITDLTGPLEAVLKGFDANQLANLGVTQNGHGRPK
jgi:hypothetical protein